MVLSTADFAQFFRALWGDDVSPFPWQQRLLERADTEGWPGTLDLPTGTGKTSVLDIACFALSLDAARSQVDRRQPRRIALVIDRRVVVDQGYNRARHIRDKLNRAKDGVLADVASALRSLHSGLGSEDPIAVAALRGGMVRDDEWARAPDQPLIIVSTVDQIGSRLLFRGYGISDRMAPVHAGILGSDTLYLLDEVHLSRPFEQTLAALSDYGCSGLVKNPVMRAPAVVRMSATVGHCAGGTFELDSEDLAHPVLRQRISASKRARLADPVTAPADDTKAYPRIAKACVDYAREFLQTDRCDAAAIIVNRVDTAREAARLARESRWAERGGVDVELLTGRMRPLDREDVQDRVLDRIAAGRDRGANRKLLLVSTQAIEAGADFDFDALVTECASLDALRQRFGRLDRRGELGHAPAVIVASNRSIAEDADDPVYGSALAKTWAWLADIAGTDGVVDFGIAAQRELRRGEKEGLVAPSPNAPALLPAYLDAWAQTNPRPAVEPDLSVFLHGPDREAADVQIVWRADVPAEALQDDARVDDVRTMLAACPPSALEALSVPVWAARSWLAAVAERRSGATAGAVLGVADVEGEVAPKLADRAAKQASRQPLAPMVAWEGEKTTIVRDASGVRPGMTLVVPSAYGGLQCNNWDPAAEGVVEDRGDEAQLRHRGRATIRWSRHVIAGWLPEGIAPPKVDQAELQSVGDKAVVEAFADWIASLDRSELPAWVCLALEQLGKRRPRFAEVPTMEPDAPRWRIAIASSRVAASRLRELGRRGSEPTTEAWSDGDDGSFTAVDVPVLLKSHLRGVRDLAELLARSAGFPGPLVEDLALAGWLHDLGKADPRFQSMLFGGDEVRAALAEEPIAKSAIPMFDRAARQRARNRAGYPKGTRHELMSVALVESHDAIRERANDWDLVLHLVASHHGYCRPLAPATENTDPVEVSVVFGGEALAAASNHHLARLGCGVAERFWACLRRYGWHGLALLEATLRLADHRRSEAEQSAREKQGGTDG